MTEPAHDEHRLYDAFTAEDLGVATASQIAACVEAERRGGRGTILIDAAGHPLPEGGLYWVRRVYTHPR
jgi:hypothetical protein